MTAGWTAASEEAWARQERHEREQVERAGRSASQEEYVRLCAEELRAYEETLLLEKVEKAAREVARDIFAGLQESQEVSDNENDAVESASIEVATAEFVKYVKGESLLSFAVTTVVKQNNPLQAKMEGAGKDAGLKEFMRLKAEAMDIKTKDAMVKKLRVQVEEAARKAARETYSKLKSNDLDNEDTEKD